jgi:hypothetical protein
MAFEVDPIIGNWYEHLDKGLRFEVVAIDEDEGLVEIQYFNGDIEEIELEMWYDLEIEPSEPPEDWTGPMDDAESDDLDDIDTDIESDDWDTSQEELRSSGEKWEIDELKDKPDWKSANETKDRF